MLFACVENSNCSQMAEAFSHIYKTASIKIYRAGLKPARKINPKAVKALQLLNFDMLAIHRSKK